jgi:hypothetical protein
LGPRVAALLLVLAGVLGFISGTMLEGRFGPRAIVGIGLVVVGLAIRFKAARRT